ncbi:MAG: TolC family protein [Bacteroidia bacterium]|nr:TolC family protein [Bacteroidia bacterium]
MKPTSAVTIFLLLLFNFKFSFSQSSGLDSLSKSEITIPPLEVILDSALKHNAAVKFRVLDILAKNANLRSEKNYWMRNLGIQADSRYGTFDNYSLSNNTQSTTISNSTSQQMNYGVGLYLKFPIVDLIDRKNQINRAKAELEQSKQMAENQKTELTQLIIRLYEDLLLKQRLLSIQSSAIGNARVNQEMIETEFRNGIITVTEYVRVSDIVTRVESDYEKAKSEFSSAKQVLEEIAGFSFLNYQIKK